MKMTVHVNTEGTITSLRIDANGEANGDAVMDSSFRNQFIGKSAPMILGTDVTPAENAENLSQAVVDALNKLVP
jgi:hypothetical protein